MMISLKTKFIFVNNMLKIYCIPFGCQSNYHLMPYYNIKTLKPYSDTKIFVPNLVGLWCCLHAWFCVVSICMFDVMFVCCLHSWVWLFGNWFMIACKFIIWYFFYQFCIYLIYTSHNHHCNYYNNNNCAEYHIHNATTGLSHCKQCTESNTKWCSKQSTQ